MYVSRQYEFVLFSAFSITQRILSEKDETVSKYLLSPLIDDIKVSESVLRGKISALSSPKYKRVTQTQN